MEMHRLSTSRSIRDRRLAERRLRLAAAASAAGLAAALVATPAGAHGFGQRYELPLPLALYLFGGAAVVALSFVVSQLFVGRTRAGEPDTATRRRRPLGAAIRPEVLLPLAWASVGLFVLTLLAGYFGNQNPYRNLAPTLVWIIWWVGFTYISALAGNLWAVISPWQSLFAAAQWLYRRAGGCGEMGLNLRYPAALGAWPASALLLAFAWIELVDPNAALPSHIAALASAYSLLTWAGMFAFGRTVWTRHGEAFALFFALFSRLAPVAAKGGRLIIRPPGGGLLDETISTSQAAFVLLILASVLFDGLIGTPAWARLESALGAAMPRGVEATLLIKSAALVAFWPLFLSAYLAVCAAMSALAAGRPAPLALARRFALTLIPIAVGYHVAHYLVYLLIQGQYIIPLLSDPFGYGWNLFGTAGYRVDIGLVGARFAWYMALTAIVAGHVAAVYLAHLKALGAFATPRIARRTQIPLTALMVAYTFIGLSIAAEPIVEGPQAALPSAVATGVEIPPDAVLPDAKGDALVPSGMDKLARVRLTYKALGSAFHDGTVTNAADLLYAYLFAYRWGTRRDDGAPYDPAIDAATASLRRHLAAVRVTGVDSAANSFRVGDVNFVRQTITVEVYVDIAPDDPDWNAAVAPPFSTLPWHLLALLEGAVERGWGALSEAEARRRGIAWLDLVRAEELGAKLATLTQEYEQAAFVPPALRGYVGADEARGRWAALAAFYRANHHFLVTNGPYRLKSWSADGVTLEAFRDLSYPLGVGSYDVYAIPRRGFITATSWRGARLTLSGEIEVIDKFQRSYRLLRTPLASLPAVAAKRAAPECRYVVADASRRIVLAGTAPLGADGTFVIDFTGRLAPGRYAMSALIAVNGNTMNADIAHIPLTIAP
jgi:hypothetical protein